MLSADILADGVRGLVPNPLGIAAKQNQGGMSKQWVGLSDPLVEGSDSCRSLPLFSPHISPF